MSANSVASAIEALNRFRTIWHVDFEYRQDHDHRPVPVCMFAREQRTGAEIFLRRKELLTLSRAPFDTGPQDLMVAYAANAELSCFLMLGWAFPHNLLDVYVETCAAINGYAIEGLERKRPGILEALNLFGLPPTCTKAEKDRMRQFILEHDDEDYTEDEWRENERYNRSDVDGTMALLPALMSTLDLPRALHRGRYMAAAARMEHVGLPIDTDCFGQLLENWQYLRLHYITQDDEFGLYDGTSFVEQRLWDLIESKRWDWPRTPSGRYELKRETLGRQARRYPALKKLVHLRDTIAELRISNLANTVGHDSFARCPLLPFWTRTGRNQPSAKDKIFLPSLPAWLRGLLRPQPGWVLIELDWDAQEVAIMAGQSGDSGMIEDSRSGDPHWQFGVRAGLVSQHADQAEYKELRNKAFKPVVLGMNYGMTPYGIAAKTGRSLLWARDIHARHRRTYPVFHRWLGDVVAQAKFDRTIASPIGWPMAITADTTHRTLMNFPAQSSGADAMRIAAIAATEAGITVCCPVHDSFWIMAPINEVASTIATMREIMMRAGVAVTGGLPITVSVETEVTAARNLGDSRKPGDKGYEMWAEVRELLAGGLRWQQDDGIEKK